MENPKFQIFKEMNGEYYYRLRSLNGEIILSGEGYTTKESCMNGINSVKEHAPYEINYRRSYVPYYFLLMAASGETIGKSEIYSASKSMESSIESVKKDAPGSGIQYLD